MITNSSNQSIGFNGFNFINEIPGAYESLPLGGLGEYIEPTYILPEDEYTIALDGQTVYGTDTVSISQFGPGYALMVDGIDINSSTYDELDFLSNGTQLKYYASNDEELSVSMGLEQPEESLEFRLQEVDISEGQEVTATIDINDGRFKFANENINNGPKTRTPKYLRAVQHQLLKTSMR